MAQKPDGIEITGNTRRGEQLRSIHCRPFHSFTNRRTIPVLETARETSVQHRVVEWSRLRTAPSMTRDNRTVPSPNKAQWSMIWFAAGVVSLVLFVILATHC